MATSQRPRKKNPQKKSHIARYMRERAKELKEFLEKFNEQNQNMLSYDLVLRVMLNRYRILYLREDQPDLWDKYIGQYLKEDLRALTHDEKEHLLMMLYAAAVTKNTHLKNYRELVTGPIEKIRALHAICINRDPAHIQKMKGREFELESDIANAYTDMLAAIDTMTGYLSMAQDIIQFMKSGIEDFEAYDKVLIAANQEHLKTLPPGKENKPAFKVEEVEVEDLVIKYIEPRREELAKRLDEIAAQHQEVEETKAEIVDVTPAEETDVKKEEGGKENEQENKITQE